MPKGAQDGTGEFLYEFVDDWESLPEGYSWPETAGVITDSEDNVYVFNRGDHPMMVFDSNGNFLDSWGEGIFSRPHGAVSYTHLTLPTTPYL